MEITCRPLLSCYKLTGSEIRGITLLLLCFILLLIQSDIAESYGEPCSNNLTTNLPKCKQNEACSINSTDGLGICICLPEFIEYPQNKSCIPLDPGPSPSPSTSGVALGAGIAIFIITVAVLVGLLQYRYKFLNGVCHSLYRIRRRAERGQQVYEVTDDGDDDPIV